MKYAANMLTVLRILILPFLLPAYDKNTYLFIALYLLTGITDVLDGFIARRLNQTTKLGARLDSTADLMVFIFIFYFLAVRLGGLLLLYAPWLIAVAFLRIVNLIISAVKYKEPVFLHTLANKLTGLLCFICLPVMLSSKNVMFPYAIIIIAALASIEEGLIHLTSKKPDLNRKSLFL